MRRRREPGPRRRRGRGRLVAATVCTALALPTAAAAQTSATIRTVPVVPGIRIEVGGQVTRTDDNGVARFRGPVRISEDTVAVLDRRVRLSDDRRARFDELRRTDAGYVAAFDIDYRLTIDARTVGGEPIDVDRASPIWLRSPLTGANASVDVGNDVWLHGTRVVAELGTVRTRDVPWTVQRFLVDGEQVVSPGQQRIVPAEHREVTVDARLFTAEIAVRDALFGSPTGTAVLLRHPAGTATRHALDDAGTVRIPNLIPGAYDVTVTGSGPLISRPVRLSRDQHIALDVYSWWNVAIAVVTGLLFFAGLAVAGRRRPADRTVRVIDHLEVGAVRPNPDAHGRTWGQR